MASSSPKESQPIASRITDEVEHAIKRYTNGFEYISSSGPSVGKTPKDVLISRGTLNLYHYRPMVDEIYRVPLLFVMATTNRGYIVDLCPGQSFVEFLLKAGYDVFLIDWTAPRPEEKNLCLDDYVLDFIPECIRRVQIETGQEDVSLVGYCMGGVLSLIYAALNPDHPLKNLICFATPVDWRHMELFQQWSDRRYFDLDRLVDSLGNIPGEFFYTSFDMLRPASRAASQIQLWEKMWDDPYVKSFRMFDKWSTEVLPLAGEYFRQTTKELMWDNKLHTGKLVIKGRPADIKNITIPVFHAVAEHDHIVPYAAAQPLVANVGSVDKEEVMLKGGHVSLIAGPNAAKRLWPKLDSWLQVRSL